MKPLGEGGGGGKGGRRSRKEAVGTSKGGGKSSFKTFESNNARIYLKSQLNAEKN